MPDLENPLRGADLEAIAGPRPRILLVTDRTPGRDAGYSIRVENVIQGLAAVGDLHVCLVDSSVAGATLPAKSGYTATVVRAPTPARWRKALVSLVGVPDLRYRRPRDVRAALERALGAEEWDLVWCSRARTHVLTDGILPGPRVVDFDDLNDRLMLSENSDRAGRHGRLASAPSNLYGRVQARRWSRLQQRIAKDVAAVAV